MNTKEEQQHVQMPPIDFATLFAALSQPEAFSLIGPNYFPITTVQTHASAVILTPQYVYKLKKPKNFGFFDYSTPALRRHFCIQEILVNQPLAASVYLGIAPVLVRADGFLCFGPTFPPDTIPLPATLITPPLGDEIARVIDYAVVMVRLPDEATLENRVRNNTVTSAQLANVAQVIAHFHARKPDSEQIAQFGNLDSIRTNWEENFTQMQPYIGRTIDEQTYTRIATYARAFMDGHRALFANRICDGFIRACHGDLRLQHVYLLANALHEDRDAPAVATGDRVAAKVVHEKIVILDAIEFNERFRYGDVAGEIAFLAMELEAAQRPDLARAFVASYSAATQDRALCELLPFYLCYRACVRGKVASFLLDEQEVSQEQREQAQRAATNLFALAARFATGPTRPHLLLIGGLMGTGKSTLAEALHEATGYPLLSSDTVRKQLAQITPDQPLAEAFGQGIYSTDWSARTYQSMRATTSHLLHAGRSVIVDASFMRRTDRHMFAEAAQTEQAQTLFLECRCSRETVLTRLASRWQQRVEAASVPHETTQASDGRPALYDQQQRLWEAFQAEAEPYMIYLPVDTEQEPTRTQQQIIKLLGLHVLC